MELKEFIYQIPKAELHMHLEGSLEPDLKLKLAERNNIDIGHKTVEEIEETYQFNDLTSFLAVYYPGMNVLQKEEDFYDLTIAYLKKAQENNVRYAELFFDPQAHTSRGVSFDTVINGYYRAVRESHKYNLKAQLIMCFLRDLSEESALEHYEMAKPHRDKILGIGLDSDERDNPPLKFQRVFKMAKDDGYNITMHCDIDQKDSIEHIRDCLHTIKVDRVDHGTNIVEDEELVQYAIDNKIGFTCCPVSNSFVTSDMKGKEIKYLLDRGALVTINSDDPAYFKSYVSNDMFVLSENMNLTKEDIIKLAKNSFEIAWISDEEKDKYLKEIDEFAKNDKNLKLL